jgi:hypothetical protein
MGELVFGILRTEHLQGRAAHEAAVAGATGARNARPRIENRSPATANSFSAEQFRPWPPRFPQLTSGRYSFLSIQSQRLARRISFTGGVAVRRKELTVAGNCPVLAAEASVKLLEELKRETLHDA